MTESILQPLVGNLWQLAAVARVDYTTDVAQLMKAYVVPTKPGPMVYANGFKGFVYDCHYQNCV